MNTPIQQLGILNKNMLYMKRDDLIPYCFGGNKARKAFLFFQEIDKAGHDTVVTYGSSHSNHCRVVANMAAQRGMRCIIIAPLEVSDATFNSKMMTMFGAEIVCVPVEQVHDTIEHTLHELQNTGSSPYFIQGGGHGNIGTEAYVQCYDEIREYENEHQVHFDHIFFASGTGTTHAGLVCGQLINKDERNMIGISIARKNPYGRNVVIDSVRDYLCSKNYSYDNNDIENSVNFIDDHTGDGYGKDSDEITDTIKSMMIQYGIPMDSTYVAKAFFGMEKYISANSIEGKNILFIHTGGAPLFFNDLNIM